METFNPIVYCHVPASPKHDKTAKYYVALGFEDWGNDDKNLVFKIQMEYNGNRQGRKVPSYPVTQSDLSSEDWKNVNRGINLVREAYKNGEKGEIPFKSQLPKNT
ncbi:MAG: hypothetical protein E7294_04640 [Lachnospiraceae bacterium]|jgi:hypothetical protein|nr:hypothetical protein [Lachnospiraceae bacterium]